MIAHDVKVTADALNVRKKASVDGDIVNVLMRDDTVRIVEEENGFGKLEDGSGWIMLEHTEIAKTRMPEIEEESEVAEDED